MRILLIQDENNCQDELKYDLGSEGFHIAIAGAAEAGAASNYAYDLILLDLEGHGEGSDQILEKIRDGDSETPIIVLKSKTSVQDKVRFLEIGADDYLAKPYAFDELLARIRVRLRRRSAQRTDIIRIADFELDRITHRAQRNEKRIKLSGTEYALLEYLAANSGRVLSREFILRDVWGEKFERITNIVEVYVRQLRSKIDDGHEPKLINTIRGAGYFFGNTLPNYSERPRKPVY